MKLGLRRNYHKGRGAIRHYANQPAHPLGAFSVIVQLHRLIDLRHHFRPYHQIIHYLLPVYEEWGFPGEEDDDIEQIHPVRAEGVGGDVRGEVHVAARDDVEELAAGSQHPQPVHKLRTPLQNVFLWVGLKEVSITPHAHSFI